ncbi:hypothetical protein DFH29DRAFT_873759 [Suillus ampliporus]|nr:hypothetical protein DFH29DRAFT_873759 [Suillus ampliporus]
MSDANLHGDDSGIGGMYQPRFIPALIPSMAQPDITWDHGNSMMAAPAMSAPMSSGLSTGKHWHAEMSHGHSAPPSTTYTLVLQLTKPELEKKPRLSMTSGKTCPSASKKNVQDTANTAVLMNLQGTINRLSDSLSTTFAGSDEARVAENRTRALKLMQSDLEFSKEDKVIVINIFMMSPAACGTFLDIEDPELRMAFLHSIITRAKQENPMM